MKFTSVLLLSALVASVAAAPSPQRNNNNRFRAPQKNNNAKNNNNKNVAKPATAPPLKQGQAQAGAANNGAAKGGAATAGAAGAGAAVGAAAGAGVGAAAGAGAANNGNQNQNQNQNGGQKVNLQESTTIDPSVIQTTDDGQNPPVNGQTAAKVSKNNFANFCALGLPQVPITNGLQITTGSCNPIPIGNIPAKDKMPSCKFLTPKNGDTVAADTPFTITLTAKNIQLGTFTNAQKTYFANPQTLNGQGLIIGHTHFVIEKVDSLDSTTPLDPTKFQFFKGIDGGANGQGQVSVDVPAPGIPAGTYRLGTIVTAGTHQPAIVPVAQHGLLDDVVYFTATAGGAAAGAAAKNGAQAGATAGQAVAGQAGAGQATAGQATAGKAQLQGGRRQ